MRMAGIGSRETPEHICDEMIKIGQWAKKQNIIIHSGHAEGADYAFEQGAEQNCIVFLPWASFNAAVPVLGQKTVILRSDPLTEYVKKYHGGWHNLTYGGWALMSRNVHQVLGPTLKEIVDVVVCWQKKKGGTEFALNIARDLNIPIINMAEDLSTADLVIEHLKSLFPSFHFI